MKKVLKWVGIIIGGIIVLLIITGTFFYFSGDSRINRIHEIQAESLAIPVGDSTALVRGRHLVETFAFCTACHGENLEGDLFFDEPPIATVYTPNLTSGSGGIGSIYTDEDWIRAIRHGVGLEGRGLIIMHSDVFSNISEGDLAAMVAYLRSVPPVDNEVPDRDMMAMGKILVGLGLFDSDALPFIPAEVIDHKAPFATKPDEGPTAEYGRYLMSITLCYMCHGSDLKGGEPLEEGSPPAPGILVYGDPDGFTFEQFVSTIRTGVNPAGKELDNDQMPWEFYKHVTDVEMEAIWRYMASLPR